MTTLTGYFRAFSVVSVLSVVALSTVSGCGLLKKKTAEDAGNDDDAAADATVADADVVDAAPPPAAAPVAANVDDVARFPDEKPIDNVAAVLQRTTNVREIPSVGKVVASLAKGGSVTEIATRGTSFLVVFDNPKDQKRLMGWVGQDAFTATVDAGVKPIVCTLPDVPLVSDAPFCGRTCAADADCPSGQACKGAANRFFNGKLGDAVTVCTVFTARPAPAATRVVPTLPTGPGVVAIPNTDVAAAVGGRCAAGFSLIGKDLQCHKSCVGGCRPGNTCQACQGQTVCGKPGFCK